MQRCLLAACLAAGCGDNLADCGFVQPLSTLRNIWPHQLAIDDTQIYYSDYNNDGFGTHVIFRQPRDRGSELALAARTPGHGFGYGMAVDDTHLYWTAETDPLGYAVFSTPREGGRTFELAAFGSACVPHGIAVDASAVYAGVARCEGLPAQVIALFRDGTQTTLWESPAVDVEAIASHEGRVFIATTGGLVRLDTPIPTLLDGHPIHRLQITPDELLYSTDEGVFGIAYDGGTPRRLYEFTTPVGNLRAFAVSEAGLFVSEPPRIMFVPATSAAAVELVGDAGNIVAYLLARDRVAYWSALALPDTLGLADTQSGGVLRVTAPCD